MLLMRGQLRPESQRHNGCSFKIYNVDASDALVNVQLISPFNIQDKIVEEATITWAELGPWLNNRLDY